MLGVYAGGECGRYSRFLTLPRGGSVRNDRVLSGDFEPDREGDFAGVYAGGECGRYSRFLTLPRAAVFGMTDFFKFEFELAAQS